MNAKFAAASATVAEVSASDLSLKSVGAFAVCRNLIRRPDFIRFAFLSSFRPNLRIISFWHQIIVGGCYARVQFASPSGFPKRALTIQNLNFTGVSDHVIF
jgi:hypothetical protein